MADHLALQQPIKLDSRRAGSSGGGRPTRVPGQHGQKLRGELDQAINAMRPARVIDGVDPAYVFKIRSAGKLESSALGTSGLQFLGDTRDWTYFVLAPGDDPAELRDTLGSYEAAGTSAGTAPGRTFFDTIEEFLPYDRHDRRGRAVPADGEPIPEPIAVDVIAWPSDDSATARKRIEQIRAVVHAHSAAAELSADERFRFTVVRVRVDRAALDDLLDLPVVESIRLPLMPRLEPSTWRQASIEDLPSPEIEVVAPIGMIDDGVMEHPLLPAGVIASRTAIPSEHPWLPPSDHGTMVAGLCAYGDVEACLAGDEAWVACGPIHAVRVLEPDPIRTGSTRLPTDRPAYQVVEEAIHKLHAEHGVRIFNLSVTDDFGYSGPHVSPWTELLDALTRELDVVVVVAAGNHRPELPADTTVLSAYPGYLLNDSARVAEPAVAANVVTVGSIAHADAPQKLDGTSLLGDRAVARVRQPSPFTRVGPGTASGMKPDVVEHGGNWVLDDIDNLRDRDHGVSVISLVGRSAAVWRRQRHQFRGASGHAPCRADLAPVSRCKRQSHSGAHWGVGDADREPRSA